jgi:hypothetical protein
LAPAARSGDRGAERRSRRQLRHQRDADAGHDHLAQTLQSSGLHIVTATAEPDRVADRDGLVAQAMALLEQDDRFAAQRAGSDPRSAG